MKTYQLFIDGHWSDAKEKKTKHVYSPTNGEMLAVIQDGDAQDAERALLAAQHAQTDWASHSPRERAEIIRKFIGLIRSKKVSWQVFWLRSKGNFIVLLKWRLM